MSRVALVLATTSAVALAGAVFALTHGETPASPIAEASLNDSGGSDSGDASIMPDATTCTDLWADVCAPSGQPGCPGGGGLGGTGGMGGGAAVALLALGNTSVTITNGGLFAGYGGNGGPGGGGQGGGNGTNGSDGTDVPCLADCTLNCQIKEMLDGGAGGTGTTGGSGGQGGGGAGGPHYFYVEVGAAKVDASAATLSASGFLGTHPGTGGGPNGIDGGEGVHP